MRAQDLHLGGRAAGAGLQAQGFLPDPLTCRMKLGSGESLQVPLLRGGGQWAVQEDKVSSLLKKTFSLAETCEEGCSNQEHSI